MLSRRRKRKSSSKLASSGEFPVAQLGFEGSRHLRPERLPSAHRDRAVTVRVIDLTQETISNIQTFAHSIRRLDLSGLHLTELEEELLQGLNDLHKLDVSYNELTEESFPGACKNMDNLIDLTAHYNKISKIPKVFRKLKGLTRLKLGHNSLESAEGIEKLKRLHVLNLEHNKVPVLTKEMLTNLKKLEIMHFASNHLKELHTDVRHMKNLKNIDISENELTLLPAELFLLPNLEVLNASGNQIARVPSTHLRRKFTKTRLASVDLSDNVIVKFPEHLLLVSDKVDLSRNKIKAMQGNVIKRLDLDTEIELCINDNPLVNPPADVCECGLRAIIHFYQESKVHAKVYQGLKLLVLGPEGAGKTSLVQSLVDQQPRLVDPSEATIGVDICDMVLELPNEGENEVVAEQPPAGNHEDDDSDTESDDNTVAPPTPPKTLLLSISDFSGKTNYQSVNYVFLQQPSLVLLVFDLTKHQDEGFFESLEFWMNFIIAKTNKLVILPIGTHADKLPRKQVEDVCGSVHEKLLAYIEKHKRSVQREIRKIESRAHISPALSEQLKIYLALLKVQCTIFERVLPFSSANLKGSDQVLQAIQTMALNQEIFPQVMRQIPSLWVDVETYIEDKGDSLEIPMWTWEEYSDHVTNKFGMKQLLKQITQYLHDVGKVVWYSEHPSLKDYVFLRPPWLTDLMKAFFRHDLLALDYSQDEYLKQPSINQFKFEKLRNEYAETGVMDKDLLKCLWATLVPKDLNRPVMEIFSMLLDQTEIGYATKRPKEGRASTLSKGSSKSVDRVSSATSVRSSRSEAVSEKSEVSEKSDGTEKPDSSRKSKEKDEKEAEAKPRASRAVITWMLPVDPPEGFRSDYETYLSHKSLAPVFRFPRFLPPGFFESMTVRAMKPKHNMVVLYHWRGGLYARHAEQPIRLYVQRINHDDNSTCLRIECRHEEEIGDEQVEELWKVLLPYIRDIEDLVAGFKGARVVRSMECPFCHSLSFLGEWLTPKEFQSIPLKLCEVCKKEVKTCYLVQPKEKSQIEEFLRQRLLKREELERRELELRQAKVNDSSDNQIGTETQKRAKDGANKDALPPVNGQKGSAGPKKVPKDSLKLEVKIENPGLKRKTSKEKEKQSADESVQSPRESSKTAPTLDRKRLPSNDVKKKSTSGKNEPGQKNNNSISETNRNVSGKGKPIT